MYVVSDFLGVYNPKTLLITHYRKNGRRFKSIRTGRPLRANLVFKFSVNVISCIFCPPNAVLDLDSKQGEKTVSFACTCTMCTCVFSLY